MNRRKLFFLIILPVLAAVATTATIIWRNSLIATFPISAQDFVSNAAAVSGQAFRETFGMAAVEDGASGTLEEIALGNEVSDSDSNSNSISNPLSGATVATESSDNNAVLNDGAMEPAQATTSVDPSVSFGDAPALSCPFPSSPPATSSLSQKIILNEIAWMGTAVAGNQEWMELKNISGSDINLAGWVMANASGKLKVNFGGSDRIAAGGFFLLVHGSTTLPYAHVSQLSYSGDLRNAGDDLALLDPACGVSDFVAGLANGWFAGNNTTKQTMERNDADAADTTGPGWHTSVNPGGSPGAENSVVLPPAQYKVTVMFEGESGGTVTSNPSGMTCTTTQCVGTFIEKTKLSLTEQPAAGALFDGWSGACSGKGKCSFVVVGDTTLTASFHMPVITVPNPDPVQSPSSSSSDSNADANDPVAAVPEPTSTSVAGSHILIAAVQIAGEASTNDFVKLYNPSSATVDLDGWKLRKRSQTGVDYSLRTIPADMTIGPGKYFVWANSGDGFSASIGANISSTETLAGNNSIALIDADGDIEDALAWGTGTGQYGEGAPYADNPAAGQVLARKMSASAPTDTRSNADDFVLQ
jgi:hypothetical protein